MEALVARFARFAWTSDLTAFRKSNIELLAPAIVTSAAGTVPVFPRTQLREAVSGQP
jgi:hypothetical protein